MNSDQNWTQIIAMRNCTVLTSIFNTSMQSRHSVSLHGRLEVIGGAGYGDAAERRNLALNTAHSMQMDRASFLETTRAGSSRIRRGFGKVE